MKRLIFLSSLLVLFSSPWVWAQDRGPDISSLPVSEEIRLRQGELPIVNLTRDILFHILVAEFALQDSDYDRAATIFTQLATTTLDPRLAKRGFQAAMAARDMARAYQAAKQWALLAPHDSEAIASSLALAAASGQTTGLARALTARIANASDKEQALIQALAIVSKMQDKRIALEVLEKAISPDLLRLPLAHLVLSDASWEALDAYRALKEARAALQLDPESEEAVQRILQYGLEVNEAEAFKQTESWLAEHPDAIKLQRLLIARLVERRQFDKGLDYLRGLRKRSPEDFDLLFAEAEVNIKAENYEQAKTLLHEYIEVQTQRRKSLNDDVTDAMAQTSDARFLLVTIAEAQKDYAQAIAELDKIDDPDSLFRAQTHKAVLQGRMGKILEARKTIESLSLRDDRERSVAALTLASIYRLSGRTDEAVSLLVKADKEIPNTPSIKYDLAMLYQRQGRTQEFEVLLRQILELEPDNAEAYNALGYTYVDENRRLDEAQNLLERALDLDPDNPYILDSVGWYFYRVADYEAALEYLQRSFERLPEAEVAAHLGEVLWVTNQRDEARRIWALGAEKEADNETLLKTLKRFGVSLP